MCYSRRDFKLEEEAGRLRVEEERRRQEAEARRAKKKEKPVIAKVREMVGVR